MPVMEGYQLHCTINQHGNTITFIEGGGGAVFKSTRFLDLNTHNTFILMKSGARLLRKF